MTGIDRGNGGGTSSRLVIDTATRQSSVGAGAGRVLLAESLRTSEHRHGTLLLEQIQAVLDEAGVSPRQIAAVGVGTGPGSFTGLRVGMATAKTLAYALGVPIVGIASTDAIARAVATGTGAELQSLAIVLPAGARDYYYAAQGEPPRLVAAGEGLSATDRLAVAVDLPGNHLGPGAAERGLQGLRRLTAALLELLDERLMSAGLDDVAALVPAYVALPRGVRAGIEGMAWLPDLR